ncbi:BtrH N-terminal domain-containing protein [Paraconexibacter algicola]|uniref:DUF4872 domain-containing protein n=1 Tax=Paraconexibacter algicola TaxID=2133960 RepID=A0A2T4UK12_9ACTN|nr:BtrH N-terminal domain-containing protein [Paraconexibacter algicola]PTL59583.1 hypothetical protein C7Y72_07940 [Paraconexibacter algicola]
MSAPIASRQLAYPHRLAGHCGSGSIRDLLEFHRLDYGTGPLSEGACFGLGGGLGFFSLELPEMTPPVYLVGRTGEFEEDVATNLGASLEIRETEDPAVGWQTVRDEVDAGRPSMLWADIAELEYLRVRMSNTRHDIVVIGYDEEQGIAFVADNDRDEIQRCSLKSLARARSSHGFPGPNRHRVFVYDWPERLRDPREATRLALGRAVQNMRQDRVELLGMAAAGGVPGVATFAEQYRTWPGRFGERTDAALGALRVLIVKAGTGGALFRSLHAEFLRDMSVLLDDAALRSAADIYDELAEAWIELADHAGERRHGDGIATTLRIAELERHGVEAMERWEG